jgi:hypothetical protein
MTASEKLSKFNLEDHGDRHERERWALVRDRFGNYEIFWRLYLVPLTNRVCGPPKPEDTSWIRVRRDIPEEWEKLTVCHYSTFYHLSRAAERRIEQAETKPNEPTFPEDVIYLLQTCCENVSDFYDAVRSLGGDTVHYLPHRLPNDFPLVVRKIDAYRNLLIHNPVLGRGEKDGETLLLKLPDNPKLWADWKKRFRFSWRAVEELGPEGLIPTRMLLQMLEDELGTYLNHMWERILRSLAGRKPHDTFKAYLRVPESTEWISVFQPFTASGTFMK